MRLDDLPLVRACVLRPAIEGVPCEWVFALWVDEDEPVEPVEPIR